MGIVNPVVAAIPAIHDVVPQEPLDGVGVGVGKLGFFISYLKSLKGLVADGDSLERQLSGNVLKYGVTNFVILHSLDSYLQFLNF